LGVRLAPDGNNEDKVKHLRGVAEKWKDHIRTGHLQCHEAWYALLTATVTMKTIEYPLLALTLTERQCTHIMAPILMRERPSGLWYLPRILSKRHCVSCAHQIPRHGIEEHLYHDGGLLRIDLIASEGKANSITGGLVRTSIGATKLELGLVSSVFESNFKKFGKLATEYWITNSWKLFMEEFNITTIKDTPLLTLQRVGDKFIIDSFHRHGFKGKQLVWLNLLCRLFLQVTTLADILTADGKLILTHEAARHGILDTTRPSYFT
jgi:hypothetical protein